MGHIWAGHWICLLAMAGLALAVVVIRRQARAQAAERWRERRTREELEAYAAVDPTLSASPAGEPPEDPAAANRALSRRVCRVVAEKSPFDRVSMLLRNVDGRLVVQSSAGIDDLTLAAVNAWADRVLAEERAGGPAKSIRAGVKSFTINIGEWVDFDREVNEWAMNGHKELRKHRRAVVTPIRTGTTGRMTGALIVMADKVAYAERRMGPIEGLAARLARSLESEGLRNRLLRAEKLAGLGQLAGGVAHALNNPLTAVLGFAELIAETTADPRVRQDAETIVAEALKMKDTVEKLVEFWRPTPPANDAVALDTLLRQLAQACQAKLAERAIKLEIAAADTPTVRGSADRLRQMLEHLFNNAAQSIALARPREEGEEHAIRVTVSHDGATLHLIVSDTGTGFREPARAFDPFYTTRAPEGSTGLGLSICYSVVREHGGEISAFNLHPHGAAVVVELPFGTVLAPEKKLLTQKPVAA